jgi:GNAT superfamily N-acetyltransferase
MLSIVQASGAEDMDALRGLVREFTEWAFTLDPDAATAPTFKDLEAELAALPGVYAPPSGAFLLARLEWRPVGCVAFRDLDPGTVELKRMYVRPAARGNRIGEALVAALIAEARNRGKRRFVLDSYHTMTSAHRVYRAAGFVDVAAPADFPPHYAGRVVFMECALN